MPTAGLLSKTASMPDTPWLPSTLWAALLVMVLVSRSRAFTVPAFRRMVPPFRVRSFAQMVMPSASSSPGSTG